MAVSLRLTLHSKLDVRVNTFEVCIEGFHQVPQEGSACVTHTSSRRKECGNIINPCIQCPPSSYICLTRAKFKVVFSVLCQICEAPPPPPSVEH